MTKRRSVTGENNRRLRNRNARNRVEAHEDEQSMNPTTPALSSLVGSKDGAPDRAEIGYLSDTDLQVMHRRQVASQIGQIAGNRHVQRVVQAAHGRQPIVQRVWDPPELQASAIRFLRAVGQATAAYNDYELRAQSDEETGDLTSYGSEAM
jgi:hypothetical protein